MRDTIVAITFGGAVTAGERARDSDGSDEDVVLAVMKAAKEGWMAPDEGEAFAAALNALIKVWPDRADSILAEARAIGDRNKMLQALFSGVPVDMEAWAPAEFPDDSLDLIGKWKTLA